MNDAQEEYCRVNFQIRMPNNVYRFAWFGFMLALGITVAKLGFVHIAIVPLLALISGISSNWSG